VVDFFQHLNKNKPSAQEPHMSPSYKAAFGSFLKQEDLQGKAVKAVIASVEPEEVKDTDSGKLERKLVMHFAGKDKALILNRTNCESLEEICGTDDYGAWVGHAVVLYVDPSVMFGGKRVGGLRIRSVSAPAAPPPPPVREPGDDDDSVGF
jgi:hypothetical protein